MPHLIPDRPWQIAATDLFTWNNENFIVPVDQFSRYFELDQLHSMTASAVIHKLKAAFIRHGIPETVISDNGPQYKCKVIEASPARGSSYYPPKVMVWQINQYSLPVHS